MKRIFWLFFVLIFTLPAVAQTPEPTEEILEPGPDQIEVVVQNMHPEGIEYTNGHFLLGSLNLGTVFTVEEDGTVTPFIEDERFESTVGIHVDEATNRLLVCNSTFGQLAALGAYDLETGEEIFYVDLGALLPDVQHFANDVTVDDEGNAYVTDSVAGVFYKIDLEGNAEVFLEDESFKGGLILNGLDYHDGYIIAVRGQELIKIDVATGEFTVVEPEQNFQNGDGLNFMPDGSLIMVLNSQHKILQVVSEDDFATATVAAMVEVDLAFPTTVTNRGDEIYVVDSKLNQRGQEVDSFPIQKVVLETVE